MRDLASLIAASGLPRIEAAILAGHVLGRGRAWIAAHGDEILPPPERTRIESLLERRRHGEPVAYLTGMREFRGLDFIVSPEVLIPRPETELLVDLALERLPAGAQARVADLGTGSGAVAIAIAIERPEARVVAVDLSDGALRVARANAVRLGARVEFVAGSWFQPLQGRTFDMVVSNPPYVARGDRHLEEGDVRHEPRLALESGPDGTDALREIALAARGHLATGGWLLMEHGYDQREAVLELLAQCGYSDIADHEDLAGQPRVVVGRWGRDAG